MQLHSKPTPKKKIVLNEQFERFRLREFQNPPKVRVVIKQQQTENRRAMARPPQQLNPRGKKITLNEQFERFRLREFKNPPKLTKSHKLSQPKRQKIVLNERFEQFRLREFRNPPKLSAKQQKSAIKSFVQDRPSSLVINPRQQQQLQAQERPSSAAVNSKKQQQQALAKRPSAVNKIALNEQFEQYRLREFLNPPQVKHVISRKVMNSIKEDPLSEIRTSLYNQPESGESFNLPPPPPYPPTTYEQQNQQGHFNSIEIKTQTSQHHQRPKSWTMPKEEKSSLMKRGSWVSRTIQSIIGGNNSGSRSSFKSSRKEFNPTMLHGLDSHHAPPSFPFNEFELLQLDMQRAEQQIQFASYSPLETVFETRAEYAESVASDAARDFDRQRRELLQRTF